MRPTSSPTAIPTVIRTGTLDEALALEERIPEFSSPYSRATYLTRLSAPHLILVAEEAGELLGYKVGYALSPTTFYSWVGGVLPSARRLGLASTLREHQEHWARSEGYTSIEVKSMNSFPAMLTLLISAGYAIVAVEGTPGREKIRFAKDLTSPASQPLTSPCLPTL